MSTEKIPLNDLWYKDYFGIEEGSALIYDAANRNNTEFIKIGEKEFETGILTYNKARDYLPMRYSESDSESDSESEGKTKDNLKFKEISGNFFDLQYLPKNDGAVFQFSSNSHGMGNQYKNKVTNYKNFGELFYKTGLERSNYRILQNECMACASGLVSRRIGDLVLYDDIMEQINQINRISNTTLQQFQNAVTTLQFFYKQEDDTYNAYLTELLNETDEEKLKLTIEKEIDQQKKFDQFITNVSNMEKEKQKEELGAFESNIRIGIQSNSPVACIEKTTVQKVTQVFCSAIPYFYKKDIEQNDIRQEFMKYNLFQLYFLTFQEAYKCWKNNGRKGKQKIFLTLIGYEVGYDLDLISEAINLNMRYFKKYPFDVFIVFRTENEKQLAYEKKFNLNQDFEYFDDAQADISLQSIDLSGESSTKLSTFSTGTGYNQTLVTPTSYHKPKTVGYSNFLRTGQYQTFLKYAN